MAEVSHRCSLGWQVPGKRRNRPCGVLELDLSGFANRDLEGQFVRAA